MDPAEDNDPTQPQSWNKYSYARNNPILLTDPDGRIVTYEGDDEYNEKTKGMIQEARSKDKRFDETMTNLENSKNTHAIKPWDSQHTYNQNASDDTQKASDGTGTGSTTYFNPDVNKNADGQVVPAKVNVMHEMSHAEDADTGTRNPQIDPVSGVKTNEIKAVRFENIFRRALGLPERTTYGGKSVPNPSARPQNPWKREE